MARVGRGLVMAQMRWRWAAEEAAVVAGAHAACSGDKFFWKPVPDRARGIRAD